MAKFIIEPHFRLQEWIAHDKGYFAQEGLDYEFRELIKSSDGKHHDKGDKVGAFQSFEQGRKADVSCACHWTINVAASKGHGRMANEVYSVAPAGIFVQPDSKIKTPEDLAGVPISVGYQSGSHYATVQALEQYMAQDRINLVYADGMLFARMDKLLDGSAPAVNLFGGPYYFAEQLGYRKVIDTTFMIGMMVHGNPDPEDMRKFFRALRRAQLVLERLHLRVEDRERRVDRIPFDGELRAQCSLLARHPLSQPRRFGGTSLARTSRRDVINTCPSMCRRARRV